MDRVKRTGLDPKSTRSAGEGLHPAMPRARTLALGEKGRNNGGTEDIATALQLGRHGLGRKVETVG